MSPRKVRHLTMMVMSDDGRDQRSYRVRVATLRLAAAGVLLLALVFVAMASSWWFVAARAQQAGELEQQVARLEAERGQIATLVQRLEEVEGAYNQLRSLFGSSRTDASSSVWLPPPTATRTGTSRSRGVTAAPPDSWPLTERGFVTQQLGSTGDAPHPGLDIAVPTDSYVRAAGPGTVVDAGDDRVYGRFVVIDHGDGYSTLYGHASLRLVERGQQVRRNEVIALSGSTGQSTAPHLHFEILLNGEAVDPLTLVTQP